VSQARRRGKRRTFPVRAVVAIVVAVFLFALGIALGEALKDNPKPHLTVTSTKTIVP
jgi:hypothetical protein